MFEPSNEREIVCIFSNTQSQKILITNACYAITIHTQFEIPSPESKILKPPVSYKHDREIQFFAW